MPKLPSNDSLYEEMYHESHDPENLIVKSNPLVQETHYSMPLSDQKVLASLIQAIKPGQKTLTVRFSTKKFMRMCGLRKGGTTFAGIMHSLYHILNDNFFIRRPDGKYESWIWLDKIIADPHGKDKGTFLVRFRPELRQYLFTQALKYKTIYTFSDIMLMQSQYSPRLYEIFRSNQSKQKVQKRGLDYSINELKKDLNLMYRSHTTGKVRHDKYGYIRFMYPRFYNFNNRVLRPARREINLLTEYNVRMKRLRRGRKVIGINVVMLKKNKKQRQRRDDIIYCIQHHIPKSEWNSWREDMMHGNFRKVHPRKTKKRKQIDAKIETDGPHDPFSPFKEINIKGDLIKYNDPLVHKFVWTTRRTWRKHWKLYNAVQNARKSFEKNKKV